jgi:hypothetical protein
MKKIFISHPYANNPEQNKVWVDNICKQALKDGFLPISPLHAFSYMENDTYRTEIMNVCAMLIAMCDEVWIYGWSAGCQQEYAISIAMNKEIKMRM